MTRDSSMFWCSSAALHLICGAKKLMRPRWKCAVFISTVAGYEWLFCSCLNDLTCWSIVVQCHLINIYWLIRFISYKREIMGDREHSSPLFIFVMFTLWWFVFFTGWKIRRKTPLNELWKADFYKAWGGNQPEFLTKRVRVIVQFGILFSTRLVGAQ